MKRKIFSALLLAGAAAGGGFALRGHAASERIAPGARAVCVTRAQLVGTWQASPSMAAGWNRAFQFAANGTFAWHEAEGRCDARELSRSGTWRLRGHTLSLTTTRRRIVSGGRLVPATGSCSSQFEIEGGRMQTVRVRPRVQRLDVDDYSFDRGDARRLSVFVGRTKFWKYSSRPSYYDQHS